MRHDPGLAASPPARRIIEMEGRGDSSFAFPLLTGKPPTKLRRGSLSAPR